MPTIATFNLCNFGADASPARLARLGAIIAQELEGPDILAVQEVKGLATAARCVDFHGISSKNLLCSQEPTASWAGSDACGEGVRPGGACGRLISVKLPTVGSLIGENQAVPSGNLNEARNRSWNKKP